ncbi:MAG: tetratricopeptide repeat protein [Deltaproteobacteria bacterium]|jgi:hypothetical protein
MMRSIALALSLVFLAPTVAEAVSKRDRTRAKRFARRAARSFKLKRYKQALRDFERAYDLVELPALRYNIGQCHLLLGHYDDAIASFERFLEESPDTPYANDVRALIAEADAEIEKRKPKPEVPIVEEEPAIAVLDDPPPPVVPPPPSPAVTTPPPAPPVAEPGDDDGFPMWVVWAIVGGVAVAGGTAAIVAAQPDTTIVLPMGDLGVIDRRGPR